MSWIPIRYTITTPAFIGGAGAEADSCGVRVPEIRGAMRYWFRALSGLAVGDDLSRLLRSESHVFGSTLAQSPVRVRCLPPKPRPQPKGPASWLNQGTLYLLGPGLGRPRSKGDPAMVMRGYLNPGDTGIIEIDPGLHAKVVAGCLWAISTLGGIGGRTRRGFGGIAFDHEDLQKLWSETPRLFPTLEAIRRVRLAVATAPTVGEKGNARFPHLADAFAVHLARGGWRSWEGALSSAGRALRENRGSAPGGRFGHTPEYNDVVEPWVKGRRQFASPPEFPLGAFGLPIVFKHGAKAQPRLKSDPDPVRRSSPLWIRTLEEAPGSWVLVSFVLAGEFLPVESEVVLTDGERTQGLKITPAMVQRRLLEWFTAFDALDRGSRR